MSNQTNMILTYDGEIVCAEGVRSGKHPDENILRHIGLGSSLEVHGMNPLTNTGI